MKNARVTISRVHGGGDSCVSIAIEDDSSGLRVVGVRMSLEDFALCVTGQGRIHAAVERWVGDKAGLVGKTREVRSMFLDGRPPYDKESASAWVRAHPQLVLSDGWMLSDDGTRTQQHARDKHRVTLIRYMDTP